MRGKTAIIEWDKLKQKIAYENKKDSDPLKKQIKKKITLLEKNHLYGEPIPRRLTPKEYIKKGFKQVYYVNLNYNAWRLIYGLAGDDIMIFAVILDYMDHKTYCKKFGYNPG